MQDDISKNLVPATETGHRSLIKAIAEEHAALPAWVEDLVREIGEKLNRTDIHFAAELVQNAEDAGNRSDQDRVELRFLIEEGRIIVQNDGRPFDQDDAAAICRAAASSKRHSPNQIGFLGVGFKSVFKITDVPEIHSNGYHFRITRYIHPSWIDNPLPVPDADMHSAFVFPVKPSINLATLSAEFDRLKPTMLLFLKKLKSIAIENRVTGLTSIVELREGDAGNAILDSLQGQQRWRIVTLTDWNPPLELRPDERKAHNVVEIRAAFALSADGQFERLPSSLFFAFLPTEQETGLGFHLQADFVPTLSRESIEDSPWNRAILTQAALGLVQQLCILRDEGRHSVDIYNLVPLEGETRDIATIVAHEARIQAQNERLILTRSQGWLTASDAYIPQFVELRELLTADDLSHHYGCPVDFVHAEIRDRALVVVEQLGVETFGIPDLIEVLADDERIAERGNTWLVRLLVFLYERRDEVGLELLHQLRQIRLLPLETGSNAAADPDLNSRPVYLPLKNDLAGSYDLFSAHLDLIARGLIEAGASAGYGEQLLRAIRWLGVKAFEPAIVIDEIILPIFEPEVTTGLDHQRHTAYLDFVRRHWREYQQPGDESAEEKQLIAERLRRAAAALRFRIEHNDDGFALAAALALGSAYAPEEKLEQHLLDLAGVQFVSSEYAEAEKKARKKKLFTGSSWREFLSDLGALDRLDVVRVVDTIILPQFQGEGWKNNNWFSLTNFLRFHSDDYERERRKQASHEKDPFALVRTQIWVASTQREPVWNFYHPAALYLPVIEVDGFNIPQTLSSVLSHYFVDLGEYIERCRADQNGLEADELEKGWLNLFGRIGAQKYTPASLIEKVILPAYEQGKWEALDALQQLQALDFVRRHYSSFLDAMRQKGVDDEQTNQRLGTALRFLARSDTTTYCLASELFLSQPYAPEDNLEQQLAGLPGIQFIDACYADHTSQKPLVGPSWKEFLGRLGAIYRFEVVQIIDQTILPQFAGDAVPDGWFELTDFIRQHLTAYEMWHARQLEGRYYYQSPHPLAKLREELWIASTQVRDGEQMFQLPTSLYRSRPYWDASDIQLAFGDLLAGSYISESYWQRSTEGKSEEERRSIGQGWRLLFEKIGVREYLPLDERVVEEVWSYPGRGITWTYISGTRSVSIHDHWNSVAEKLLKSFAAAKRPPIVQARALLRMLSRQWDDHYHVRLQGSYHWFYYSPQSKMIPSAFAALLRSHNWIPTLANTLESPGTRLFSRRLEQHIGDPAQVCAEEVRSANLRSFLNIQDTLTADDVLELLEKARAKDEPVAAQMQALYKWLQEQWPKLDEATQHRLTRAFKEREIIFLPGTQPTWLNSDQCTWQASPLKIVAAYAPSLANRYDGLRTLFVDYLRIDETPTLSDIFNAIVALHDQKPLAEDQLKEIHDCYVEIEERLKSDAQHEIVKQYLSEPVWLCTDRKLRPAPEVYAHDNVTVSELFGSSVHCLWVPPGAPFGALDRVWSAFQINRLSEAVPTPEAQSIAATAEPVDAWSHRLQLLMGYITRYLYTYQHSIYQRLWANGVIEVIFRLNIVAVEGKIAVNYRLPHSETASTTQPIFVDLNKGFVYLIPDLQLSDLTLAQELVRVLSADRELQNFVEGLLLRIDDPNLDRFIKQKNLVELPPEVLREMQTWEAAIAPALEGDHENSTPAGPKAVSSTDSSPETASSHRVSAEDSSGDVTQATEEEDSSGDVTQATEEDVSTSDTDIEIPGRSEVARADQTTGNTPVVTDALTRVEDRQERTEADKSSSPMLEKRPFIEEAQHHQDIPSALIQGALPRNREADPVIEPVTASREPVDADVEDSLSPKNGRTGSTDESKLETSERPATTMTEPPSVSSDPAELTIPATKEATNGSSERRQENSRIDNGTASEQSTDSRVTRDLSNSTPTDSGLIGTAKRRSRLVRGKSRQTTREDRHRPRLRSYVERQASANDQTRDDDKGETQAERERIQRAGERAARKYEESQGRTVRIHPHNHKGWDMDSLGPDRRHVVRRIEVKATRYPWDGWGVGLTAAEFEAARQYGDEYFLYVVEQALDPDRSKLHIFQNPAKLIGEYRFDDQWKLAAHDTRLVIDIRSVREQTTGMIQPEYISGDRDGRNPSAQEVLSSTGRANGLLIELLRRAVNQSLKVDAWVNLSTVGSTIRQIQPGFNPTTYGYTGLLALLKALPREFEIRQESTGAFSVRCLPK